MRWTKDFDQEFQKMLATRSAAPNFGELAGRLILQQVREDQNREGLVETPRRFAKALAEICAGYGQTLTEVVGAGIFSAEGPGLVAVNSVEFFSLCEHHMLPFWGRASVSYYPDKSILGLSKVARVVSLYSRRLQVQERLTREIADGLVQTIAPRAVAVRVEASHACMMMRGVEKQASRTVTEYGVGVDKLTPFEQGRLMSALGDQK